MAPVKPQMPARRRVPQGCGPRVCPMREFFAEHATRQTSCYSCVQGRDKNAGLILRAPFDFRNGKHILRS